MLPGLAASCPCRPMAKRDLPLVGADLPPVAGRIFNTEIGGCRPPVVPHHPCLTIRRSLGTPCGCLFLSLLFARRWRTFPGSLRSLTVRGRTPLSGSSRKCSKCRCDASKCGGHECLEKPVVPGYLEQMCKCGLHFIYRQPQPPCTLRRVPFAQYSPSSIMRRSLGGAVSLSSLAGQPPYKQIPSFGANRAYWASADTKTHRREPFRQAEAPCMAQTIDAIEQAISRRATELARARERWLGAVVVQPAVSASIARESASRCSSISRRPAFMVFTVTWVIGYWSHQSSARFQCQVTACNADARFDAKVRRLPAGSIQFVAQDRHRLCTCLAGSNVGHESVSDAWLHDGWPPRHVPPIQIGIGRWTGKGWMPAFRSCATLHQTSRSRRSRGAGGPRFVPHSAGPVAERLVECLVLDVVPADADPKPGLAARQQVQRGRLLCDQRRLALGQHQHSGHHFESWRDARQVPEQHEHFVKRAMLVIPPNQFRVVGGLAAAKDMVVREQVGESDVLRRPVRTVRCPQCRCRSRSGERQHQCESRFRRLRHRHHPPASRR